MILYTGLKPMFALSTQLQYVIRITYTYTFSYTHSHMSRYTHIHMPSSQL